ncbi:hypothetical protein PR048_010495 [Dryococelus australis]|uniref:Uncharacterized protein n=1 Tax=Dryococelus australis TaxID=614101 RepID=A0ABQ9I2X5_9NEOP|nr:hypothetical protein PR048_010495 [Dryococelus australis]
MLSSLTSLEQFRRIGHYFPIIGHSFLSCDRDFALHRARDRLLSSYQIPSAFLTSNNGGLSILRGLSISRVLWQNRFLKTTKQALNQTISYTVVKQVTIVTKPIIYSLVKHQFRLLNCTLPDLVLSENTAYLAGCIPINQTKMNYLRKLQNYVLHTEDCQSFSDESFLCTTFANEE